jgi:hypothetical protein
LFPLVVESPFWKSKRELKRKCSHDRPSSRSLRFQVPIESDSFLYESPVARSRQVYMKPWWKHCLLLSTLPGLRADTYRHKKSFQWSTCLVRIAGPCPAEPLQLVPASCGVRACESPPKRGLYATRPPLSGANDTLKGWAIPVMSAPSLLKLDSASIA